MRDDTITARLYREGATEIRKIFFRDLILDTHIGVHESEQGRTQRLLMNVELYLEPPAAPLADDIANVFDYDQIRRGIRRLTRNGHINLQETLVEQIVELCLSFTEVRAVRASTAKPDVYPDVAAVGYEVTRIKPTAG